MDCLGNLEKCNASCCRTIAFTLDSITPDMKKYCNYHENIKVVGNTLIISTKCSMLDENNRCKVHFKGKPNICKEGPTLDGAYFITKGCLLE